MITRHEAIRAAIEMREVGHDGQDGCARKSQAFKILAVELRIAERELAAVDVGAELAAAPEALPRQRAMHARRSTREA